MFSLFGNVGSHEGIQPETAQFPKHGSYSELKGQVRNDKIQTLKRELVGQQMMFHKQSSDVDNVVRASLIISKKIAKHSKAYSDGDFARTSINERYDNGRRRFQGSENCGREMWLAVEEAEWHLDRWCPSNGGIKIGLCCPNDIMYLRYGHQHRRCVRVPLHLASTKSMCKITQVRACYEKLHQVKSTEPSPVSRIS